MSSDIHDDVAQNIARMQAADTAFNRQDIASFNDLHADDVEVYISGRTKPSVGLESHRHDCEGLWSAFSDIQVESDPYHVTFGGGDWTCAISMTRGTHTGPLPGPGGVMIPPTNKTFRVNFATMCRWRDGKIIQEHVFWDTASMLEQLGIVPPGE